MVSVQALRIAAAVFLSATAALFTGCVSWKSCRVTSVSGHTDVELNEDCYGLVPGICGFVTHASSGYTFRLPGLKTEYRGDEVRDISHEPDRVPYGGTLNILRDRRRVVVKLNRRGHPFELNGTYRYR